MKELTLRGCNVFHHPSGVYTRGKSVQVSASLAKELMALRTEKGAPYFLLKADAEAEDSKTPNERHLDRVNAGANVLTLDDVVPEAADDEPADVVDEDEESEPLESGVDI